MLRFFVLYGIFLLLFFSFYFIAFEAYDQGYLHMNLLFYAEKVLLAKEGTPPRLENIGLVYPPLAFIPFWILKNYLLVSPFVSALLLTTFLYFLLQKCQRLFYSIIPFLLLNPLMLFLSVYRFEVLAFYLLLTLSVVMLVLHMEKGYSLYLFVGGLLFGACFFLDFRSLFLVPFVVGAVLISTKEKDISYRMALLIVKLAPIVFLAFAWLYLNWIFTENPFTFITSPYSFFKSEPVDTSLLEAKANIFKSLKYTLFMLVKYLPITLPYFLVFFHIKKYRVLYLMPVYMVYLSPLALLVFSVYFSVFFPAYYYAVLFLLFAITFQASFGLRASKPLMLSFLLSLVLSWVSPLYSKENNEKNFLKFLITGKVEPNLTPYKETAHILKKSECKNILIDDAGGFPLVIFYGQTKSFYLPYMYEYYTVLSYPLIFTDCVVVDKLLSNDKVSQRFPKASMGVLKGYSLLYEGERYNIFKKF